MPSRIHYNSYAFKVDCITLYYIGTIVYGCFEIKYGVEHENHTKESSCEIPKIQHIAYALGVFNIILGCMNFYTGRRLRQKIIKYIRTNNLLMINRIETFHNEFTTGLLYTLIANFIASAIFFAILYESIHKYHPQCNILLYNLIFVNIYVLNLMTIHASIIYIASVSIYYTIYEILYTMIYKFCYKIVYKWCIYRCCIYCFERFILPDNMRIQPAAPGPSVDITIDTVPTIQHLRITEALESVISVKSMDDMVFEKSLEVEIDKDQGNEDICCICLEIPEKNKKYWLECGHFVCESHISQIDKCPLCRSLINHSAI